LAGAAPNDATSQFSASAAIARSRAAPLAARTDALKEQVSIRPTTRWRLGPGGFVQQSADGGTSWRTETTGVNVPMASVSAPVPNVCWAAGAGGTVLRTVDAGRTWRRVAAPDPANLVAVRASDDKAATVTAADGRVFSTADGGVTWRPAPDR
jgi:photosystem II stability/assembly factor-like uncharacterized protein